MNVMCLVTMLCWDLPMPLRRFQSLASAHRFRLRGARKSMNFFGLYLEEGLQSMTSNITAWRGSEVSNVNRPS